MAACIRPRTNPSVALFPQNDYFTVTPGKLVTDQGDGRVDYHMNDRDSIFGTISWSDTNKTSVQPFQGALDGGDFNGATKWTWPQRQLSWTRHLRPRSSTKRASVSAAWSLLVPRPTRIPTSLQLSASVVTIRPPR